MIEYLKTGTDGTMERLEAPETGCWVNAVAPTAEERELLERELGVLPEFVGSALDEEETSRIDYDDDANQIFVIVDYPTVEEDGAPARGSLPLQYDTMPLSMVFLRDRGMFVTISILDNPVVSDLAAGRIRNVDTHYRTRFLLQMLLRVSQLYLLYLRRIDRLSSHTEARLHASVRNEELIQMLNLEKSLVYFSTSLKSDEVTLNKIAQGRIIPLYEDDQDLLEDVLVEVHQAIEMANIYSGTLSGTMDAFASIISNNLNIVMKVLSVITIVMAIPNIIFGFYGMNVDLPFDGVPFFDNWAFPIVIAAVCCLVAAWIFKRKGMWH
ncbi:magnesium transporter CorA family protein [Olsenella sp. An290]|uniref:magnesium transporter CorA family protein n=1 Tax=Olsenella sp. An290 TaxID=1965625 RepID=UPI000B381475|nr:magnesium transporter CorA family protein [Olsenella sp. An290]OUO35241.1 magnesium transporter [Olsenella sp. An290]